MKNHFTEVNNKLNNLQEKLKKDSYLSPDIDFNYEFILPYSKANNISDIKLVIIGQDPTIQDKRNTQKNRQKEIISTLDLDNENGVLSKYCNLICKHLGFDLNKNVYATNLCKCIFKSKPAYNGVIDKHSMVWVPFLKEELSVFSDKTIFITLGEPLIKQLIHSNKKKVGYYWDNCGNYESKLNFKNCESTENYLLKRLYPIAHQPTWLFNKFYRLYLYDYLQYIIKNERYLYI